MIFFAYVDRRQYTHSHGPLNVREMHIPIPGMAHESVYMNAIRGLKTSIILTWAVQKSRRG